MSRILLDPKLESPCIGICKLGLDTRCIGCLRSLEEIAEWIFTSEEKKRAIWDRALKEWSRLGVNPKSPPSYLITKNKD